MFIHRENVILEYFEKVESERISEQYATIAFEQPPRSPDMAANFNLIFQISNLNYFKYSKQLFRTSTHIVPPC